MTLQSRQCWESPSSGQKMDAAYFFIFAKHAACGYDSRLLFTLYGVHVRTILVAKHGVQDWSEVITYMRTAWVEFDVHAHLVPIMSLSWILIYKLSDLSVYLDTSLSLYAYGREMRGATKSALIIRQFLTCFSIITSWVSMICFRYGTRKRGLADEFTRILSKCSTYFTFLKICEKDDD